MKMIIAEFCFLSVVAVTMNPTIANAVEINVPKVSVPHISGPHVTTPEANIHVTTPQVNSGRKVLGARSMRTSQLTSQQSERQNLEAVINNPNSTPQQVDAAKAALAALGSTPPK